MMGVECLRRVCHVSMTRWQSSALSITDNEDSNETGISVDRVFQILHPGSLLSLSETLFLFNF